MQEQRSSRRKRNHRGFRSELEERASQPTWALHFVDWGRQLSRQALAEAIHSLRWVLAASSQRLGELERSEQGEVADRV